MYPIRCRRGALIAPNPSLDVYANKQGVGSIRDRFPLPKHLPLLHRVNPLKFSDVSINGPRTPIKKTIRPRLKGVSGVPISLRAKSYPVVRFRALALIAQRVGYTSHSTEPSVMEEMCLAGWLRPLGQVRLLEWQSFHPSTGLRCLLRGPAPPQKAVYCV